MTYQLIITEKPKAAQKIAAALADGKPIKESYQGVPFYKITKGKTDIVVGSAVGHLFVLSEKEGNTWKYPVFEVEWKPTYEISEKSAFSKKYLQTIKKLCKEADDVIVATDYDIEGEVIGLNIVRFACNRKDAKRMKFSTLTKPDLVKAYDNVSPRLDWPLAEAGETRHEMDWIWGINLSRALTASVKAAGAFKVLSSGRVQGPALKIVVDREREIKAFKSTPYWQIELIGEANDKVIDAWHSEDKFWDREKAQKIFDKTKGKKASVKKVERTKFNQEPPHPFDLTTLQTEAYRTLRIAPKQTLMTAQNLYTDGYISYPRTSSQKLPKEIGYDKILKSLSKIDAYADNCKALLKKKDLKPNEGKKSDPAHPAIYPTGEIPKGMDERDQRLYDLIVRRFMATFGDIAVRETMQVNIDINGEEFIAKGTRTLEKGWHELYGRYATFKEEELPDVKIGQEVKVKDLKLHDKETQPPKRYTPASIIKELTKKNLGTKSTRAVIVDSLAQRGYVKGDALEATDLGMQTIEILEKYAPKILDEKLTRHFEVEMDRIMEGKKKSREVLDEAQQILRKLLEDFKEKEKEIGAGLRIANVETRKQERLIGKCPVCKEGDLRIIFSKKTKKQFIACNRYPACKTTFPLPGGKIQPMRKDCEKCSMPMIKVIRAGKRPFEMCINPKCETKALWKSYQKPAEEPKAEAKSSVN